MEPAARYLSLVVQASPAASIRQVLSRPDVSAELEAALDSACQVAAAAVVQQWDVAAAPDAPVRTHLLADVARQYGNLAHLHDLITKAAAGMPPGERRAEAAADAVRRFARGTALRSRLSVVVAQQAAVTARTLSEGHARHLAGERVAKRWRARRDGKACYWCQKLDGVTIGVHESFAPYLGGPVDLTGHGHPTQPPKPYRGELQGPPLHPHCRCWIEIVLEDAPALEPAPVQTGPGFISAAAIRALPESKYRALSAFLRAAVHELGQVLHRLAELR